MNWLILQPYMDRLSHIWGQAITVQNAVKCQARGLVKSGRFGVINIDGVLLPKRDMMLDMFGESQTVYGDIIDQLNTANADKTLTGIVLAVNSPGGSVEGLYETMEAVKNSRLPVTAEVLGTGASAAYSIASQASKIYASNDLVVVGSVGVQTRMAVGGDTVTITNTDSPRKHPDAATPEGVSMVREELDDIFGILAEKIAKGRGVNLAVVKEKYGQGAAMTARRALELGLIDGIKSNLKSNKGVGKMNEEEKKIFDDGMRAERSRVVAHLVLAEASKDFETAFTAIKNGEGVSEEFKARHLAAEIRNRGIQARAADAPPPITVNPARDEKDQLKAEFEKRFVSNGTVIKWR